MYLPLGQISCCQIQETDGIWDLPVWLPLLHFHFIQLLLLFHLKMTFFYLNCFQRQSVQPSRCTNEGSLSLKCAKSNFLVSFNFRKISVCYFFSSHLIPEWRDRNIRFFVLIFNGLVVLIKELWVLMWICHLISQACLSIYQEIRVSS